MTDKPFTQGSSKTSLVSGDVGDSLLSSKASPSMAFDKERPNDSIPISASYRKLLLTDLQSMHLQTNFSAPAYSHDTLSMEKHLSNLRIPPSPGSLPPAAEQRPIEERLFDATASVKILTSQVAMHIDREWRDRLFRQLDFLHTPADWEEEDEPIQQASFATFLKAIVQIKPAKRPGLGLSYEGHLIAAWTNGPNRLTIEFLQNDRVRWIVGRSVDGETEQIAGQTIVSRLGAALEPYNPEIWFAA